MKKHWVIIISIVLVLFIYNAIYTYKVGTGVEPYYSVFYESRPECVAGYVVPLRERPAKFDSVEKIGLCLGILIIN